MMEQLSNNDLDKKHLGQIRSRHDQNGVFTYNEEIESNVSPATTTECTNGERREPVLHEMFGGFGIDAALRSVALSPTWSMKRGTFPFHRLFAVSDPTSENDSSPQYLDNEDGHRDLTKEQRDVDEATDGCFESNCFHNLPLYQEYLLKSVKAGLQRVHESGLSHLVTSQCLPGLQSQPGSPSSAVASPSPPSVLQDVTACSLWQELRAVQEQGLLEVLTAREVRRQETMFELLKSEASYLKSLRVVVSHFQGSKELRNTLSSVEHHVLFSNLRNVCGVSERFLADLERHFRENVVMSQVGDIVLRHRLELRQVYVPYVTNMMYQETLITKLMQQNHRFVCILHTLEKHPKCQRQTLKSFLVLPFQRITRLKLLLETTLKLTESDTLFVGPLTQAVCALHEIVNECDCKVLCMKQTEELVHLEKRVDFDQIKAIPLITHGRYLIHEGQLRRIDVRSCPIVGSVVSFCEVYMHLFSDLLLLSIQREGQFSVQDYASFPRNVRTEHLKTDVLGLPAESFLLHLTPNHAGAATALILVATTRAEREFWVNALNSQRDNKTQAS